MVGVRARPGLVLLVVSAATFLASLDLFIVNVAFPDIRVAFPGTGLAVLSWVLNGYTVVFAALLAPAGRLADRYGRRRMFLVGVAVFTIGSALCAVAPSVPLLVAFRVVQAVGAALVMPTSLALLLAAYPAAKRAVAVSTWSAMGGMAAAVGPPIGGALVDLSWRWVFLVNLPVGVLALVFGPRVLAESKDTSTGVPDLLGAVGLVAGVGAVAWSLVLAPDAGWTSSTVLVGAGVAVAGLLWVVLRSRRHPAPVLDFAALRVPTLWLACLSMVLFGAGFGGMLFGNVLFLTGQWHWPVSLAGLAMAPGPAMVVLVSLTVSGRLSRRCGPGTMAAVGALFFGAGPLTWALAAGPTPDYVAGFLPGQFLTGIGVGLVLPSLSGLVGTVLPPAKWGAGSSMINTARQVGMVLGTAVVVALYGVAGGMAALQEGWLFIVAVSVASALGALGIAARRTADHHEPGEPGEPAEPGRPAPHGRIADPTGLPVAAAALTVVDRSGRQLARAVSDSSGGFRFGTPLAGPAVLVASHPDYHPEVATVDGTDVYPDLVLRPRRVSAAVGGTVHSAHGPVPRARVFLLDGAGAVLHNAETDDAGRYGFDDLAPGEYRLVATGFPPATGVLALDGGAEPAVFDIELAHEPLLPVADQPVIERLPSPNAG